MHLSTKRMSSIPALLLALCHSVFSVCLVALFSASCHPVHMCCVCVKKNDLSLEEEKKGILWPAVTQMWLYHISDLPWV